MRVLYLQMVKRLLKLCYSQAALMKDTNSWSSLFMVSFDLIWPHMTPNSTSFIRHSVHWNSVFWPFGHFWPYFDPKWPFLSFDLILDLIWPVFISVPDDYNQIEEKEEKKTFVNSLWADSANNPVMSSKLICVFQTENQQSKSEVNY